MLGSQAPNTTATRVGPVLVWYWPTCSFVWVCVRCGKILMMMTIMVIIVFKRVHLLMGGGQRLAVNRLFQIHCA